MTHFARTLAEFSRTDTAYLVDHHGNITPVSALELVRGTLAGTISAAQTCLSIEDAQARVRGEILRRN
jgi:hypothetical protein